MGYHYQRIQREGTKGGVWWVQYYSNGRRIRESTRTKKETEAKRFLKEREGRVATGQLILPRADRIPYEELATDLRQHYEATGQRNLKEAATRLNPLGAFFRGYRVANIFPTEITKYVNWRHEQGISNSTVNRERAV